MKTAAKTFLFAMATFSVFLPLETFVKSWVFIAAMYFINHARVVENIAKAVTPKIDEDHRPD